MFTFLLIAAAAVVIAWAAAAAVVIVFFMGCDRNRAAERADRAARMESANR